MDLSLLSPLFFYCTLISCVTWLNAVSLLCSLKHTQHSLWLRVMMNGAQLGGTHVTRIKSLNLGLIDELILPWYNIHLHLLLPLLLLILFINHNTINIHHTTPWTTYNKQSDNLPERASDRYQGIYGKRVFKTHLFSNHSDSYAFGVPLTRLAVD